MRRFLPTFLTVLCLAPVVARAAADDALFEAGRLRLADDPAWRRLLYYQKTFFGAKSRVDAKTFFLHPKGKTRPALELETNLRAFLAPEDLPEDQNPVCRFPARRAWLKERLPAAPWPEAVCPTFEKWRGRLAPGSVTFVLASAYMNNPASMYGHPFLRLNNKERANAALLDYTVSYAADTNTKNGLAFAIKGLFGGYPGRFSTEPYYFKVQKYNNIESRDLWEYDLTLDAAQIDRLLDHLWEMGQAYFDYYFLTENCASLLLPLLEVADPARRLSGRLHWKAIPVDSLRVVLSEPGLVSERRLRPSSMRLILGRRNRLAKEELLAAEAIGRSRDEAAFARLEPFTPERQGAVLDTAHDYFRFLQNFKRYQPPWAEEQERRILLRRGALAITSTAPVVNAGAPPEAGHRTGRVGLGFGARRHSTFEELSLRGALHDLLDRQAGYVPNTRLEMFHLVLSFDNRRGRPAVEKFAGMESFSLAPWDRWTKPLSWRFNIGLDQAKELGRREGKALHFTTGGGAGMAAHPLGAQGPLFYALADTDVGAGGIFDRGFRLGAGGRSGLLFNISDVWRMHLEGGWTRYGWGDVRSVTKAELGQDVSLGKDAGVRVTLRREGPSKEALLTLNFYR